MLKCLYISMLLGLMSLGHDGVQLYLDIRLSCAKSQWAGVQVGTGYFDAVSSVVTAGASSTLALTGSTENAQFH